MRHRSPIVGLLNLPPPLEPGLTPGSCFRPRHIAGVGTFQDGGLLYNNPASIALHEVGALFPNIGDPSLFVSLGTGCPLRGGPQRSSRCFWKDSFIPRLIRAFWKLGDSDRAWKQLLS